MCNSTVAVVDPGFLQGKWVSFKLREIMLDGVSTKIVKLTSEKIELSKNIKRKPHCRGI